jgi:hypothetical protein
MTQQDNGGKRLKTYKKLKSMLCAIFILAAYISIGAAYRSGTKSELQAPEDALQRKIEAYKKFKAHYEDKDFQLDSYPVRRLEHANGKSTEYVFDIYRITYGIIADNIKEYDKSRKQIVHNPTHLTTGELPDCQRRLYVQNFTGSGRFLSCLDNSEASYPISLILEALTDDELKNVAVIYEFDDGDLDIQFSLETGSDKNFVDAIFRKLHQADELNDAKRKEVHMAPILPTRSQRLMSSFIDEDKDGELDFAFIPYCINGSFFDDDPHNNTIQIALKYKLVTRKDLQGKSASEKRALEKRLGLWKWEKPSEILTSFTEHPGPDIVFYDLGTVVNSRIIDPRPDGQFDKYDFLY